MLLAAALGASALAFSCRTSVTVPAHRAAPARNHIRAGGDSNFAYGLSGSSEPLSEFDPLGFTRSAEAEVRWYREAEVTHGRVAMLAVVGMLTSEAGFHPFSEGPFAGACIDYVEQASPSLCAFLAIISGVFESYRVQIGINDPRGIATDPDTPEEAIGWSAERAITLRADYEPGELGFDPLGLFPANLEDREAIITKELNNGRLAMLAAAGIIAQELVDRKPIVESLLDH